MSTRKKKLFHGTQIFHKFQILIYKYTHINLKKNNLHHLNIKLLIAKIKRKLKTQKNDLKIFLIKLKFDLIG